MNSKQAGKKTPSFRDIVESRRIEEGSVEDEDAVASDSEDDEVSDDEHDTSETPLTMTSGKIQTLMPASRHQRRRRCSNESTRKPI